MGTWQMALFENCAHQNLPKAVKITGIWHGYLNGRRVPNSETCHPVCPPKPRGGSAGNICSNIFSLVVPPISKCPHVLPFFPFSWDKTAAGNVQIVWETSEIVCGLHRMTNVPRTKIHNTYAKGVSGFHPSSQAQKAKCNKSAVHKCKATEDSWSKWKGWKYVSPWQLQCEGSAAGLLTNMIQALAKNEKKTRPATQKGTALHCEGVKYCFEATTLSMVPPRFSGMQSKYVEARLGPFGLSLGFWLVALRAAASAVPTVAATWHQSFLLFPPTAEMPLKFLKIRESSLKILQIP